MRGELVRAWTEDELQLQGLFCAPLDTSGKPAVLHVHGASSNFYRSQFLDPLADELTARGHAFLSANTRGHDIINNVYSRDATASRKIGIAFEIFEDCVLDIDAWLRLLEERGHRRAVILGHSFGALKVAFYQGQTHDQRVQGLIFMSPADQGFWLEAMGAEMGRALSWAGEVVAQGQGQTLFTGPLIPYPMSAATIHSLFISGKSDIFKFGRPDEPWEVIARLDVPILASVGTVAVATIPSPEQAMGLLESKATASPRCDTVVLEGAPHNYRGYEAQVTEVIVSWLEEIFGS